MSSIINSPIMALNQRMTSTEDVQDFIVSMMDQIFMKDVLFTTFMLTEHVIVNGKVKLDPEDGEPLNQATAQVQLVSVKNDGRIHFTITKTAVTSKKEVIVETIKLAGAESDIKDLLVHLVNIINTLLPEEENVEDSEFAGHPF